MLLSPRRWLIATLVAAYLYFLLPATATLFYELYHLTHIGPLYWGYSGFKAAGYYFGLWDYREVTCLALAAALVLLPPAWRTLKGTSQ